MSFFGRVNAGQNRFGQSLSAGIAAAHRHFKELETENTRSTIGRKHPSRPSRCRGSCRGRLKSRQGWRQVVGQGCQKGGLKWTTWNVLRVGTCRCSRRAKGGSGGVGGDGTPPRGGRAARMPHVRPAVPRNPPEPRGCVVVVVVVV